MKKLIFAAAVLAGASALAANSCVVDVGFDLADATQWPTVDEKGNAYDRWQIVSELGTTVNWTMSADVAKAVSSWWAKDGNGERQSVGIVDFGGHTFTDEGAGDVTMAAWSDYGAEGQPCSMTLKNGILSGGTSNPNFLIGWERGAADGSFENSTVTLSDLVVTNFGGVYLGRSHKNSTLYFNNVSISAPNIAFSDVNHSDETGLTFQFTNCELNWTYADALSDVGNGLSSLDLNLHRKMIFTGAKTYVHPAWHPSGSARSMMIGYQIPYGEVLFDDHAVLHPEGAVFMGHTSTAKGWTMTFDNGAELQVPNDAIYMGRNAGGQTLILKNGAKVTAPGMSVGRCAKDVSTDNNTLVVSNADITALSAITVGGWCATGGNSHNNRALFYGHDNVFNKWPMSSACFNGSDSLVLLDDVVMNLPSGSAYCLPVNPDTTGEPWVNNEIRFDNGSQVTLANLLLGQYEANGKTCDNVKMTFGNDVTATIGFIMNSGANDTMTISNATVTSGTGQFYVGYNDPNTTHGVGNCTFVVAGDHPKVRSSDSENGTLFLWNNTTIKFILPENGTYAETPIVIKSIWSGGGVKDGAFATLDEFASKFEFPNLEQVCAKFAGSKEIELMRAKYLNISDYELTRVYTEGTEALPTGCTLTKRANGDETTSLVLTLKGTKPGFSYDVPFTSIQAYNDAVTNDASYANQDVYLVLRDKTFENYVDYSLFGQHNVKLHLFVYGCTFPDTTGAMYPDATNLDPTASNRKMIALVSAKEVWIEGCTFAAYSGDSYVVDLNLSNTNANEGCGITITNNTFAAGAGKRVPLSVKNKKNLPPAFVLITGNTFHGADGVAGTICFGDSPASSTTFCGANFPITIENNTFDEGTTTYKVMTGIYVTDGSGNKETINVPVAQSFKWFWDGVKWTSTPAFHYTYTSGSGTEADPYMMATAADFSMLDEAIKNGNVYAGSYFKLSGDVSVENLAGIGLNNGGKTSDTNVFSGIFDGDGKTITISSLKADQKYSGLFNILKGATVKNLTINMNNLSGKGFAALAGYVDSSTIENVTVTGSLTGTHNIAGLAVKTADSTFKNCVNNATISTSYTKAGGLVAFISEGTNTTFENCSNTGAITSSLTGNTSSRGVGGIVGWACVSVTFTNCANSGVITGTADLPSGSVVGAFGSLETTYSAGATVTATGCSGSPDAASYGALWTLTNAVGEISTTINDLNWATVADGVATFCDTPTTAGTYTAMMSNADAITFGTASGDTLTIATREGVSYTGTVSSAVAGCTVEGAAVEGGTAYTLVGDGLSYASAFTSIEQYNAAVNDAEKLASTYKDKDVYLVVKNFTFTNLDTVDYSLAHQSDVKLHLFFYGCTFPDSEYGAMNPSGPATPVSGSDSNRKMIAVTAMKELWVEGCSFGSYNGDSYVIDINTSNGFANEGCGVTIKGNTFNAKAGNRVPLSIKNKTSTPLAFMLITGNTFNGTDDVAGVICFGDTSAQKGGHVETYYGANFPVTIENNTFVNASQYKVMTGIYNAAGSKESIYIPIADSYTWSKVGDVWAGSVAFPRTLADGVTAELTNDGACTISGGTPTAEDVSTIGKSALKDLTFAADVSAIDANAFAKCYNVTNVAFKGAVTLADGAFLRCNSLEKISFTEMPTLGTDSIVMQSAIYMKDGMPEVYAIPEITVTGYSTVLVGKVNLTDAKWEDVTDETKKDYHFFRLELRQNQN